VQLALRHAHPWQVTARDAIVIQNRLRDFLVLEDDLPERIQRVAGVDVGFEAGGATTRAAVAVLDYPSLALVESRIARVPTEFPYIPGLLSFREIPAILAALELLQTRPDLVLADGQGIAHPRRLGIAAHLGVLTGLPSIGVGKTRLIGTHDTVPDQRGAWTPLMDNDEVVGAVLRTRPGVRPVFVSIGYRLCLETAVAWVMRCTGRYRLPETTRQAHRIASG
jgi:deoxyribonuclease V